MGAAQINAGSLTGTQVKKRSLTGTQVVGRSLTGVSAAAIGTVQYVTSTVNLNAASSGLEIDHRDRDLHPGHQRNRPTLSR